MQGQDYSRLLTPGTRVRSHYTAHWTGIVVQLVPGKHPDDELYIVRVTHDRHGNPVRKPGKARWLRRLSRAWLEALPSSAG